MDRNDIFQSLFKAYVEAYPQMKKHDAQANNTKLIVGLHTVII